MQCIYVMYIYIYIHTFNQVSEEPIVSFLRDFSAPVKLDMLRSDDELSFLMAHDTGTLHPKP